MELHKDGICWEKEAWRALMEIEADNPLRSDANELGRLILGMRAAYARGENAWHTPGKQRACWVTRLSLH